MSKPDNKYAIFFLLAIILVLMIFAFTQFSGIGTGPASSLIWLLIIAQFLVIGVLIVGAIAYSQFNKTDNKHALGLPPGSVRAFIALVLISSFLVVSVFMFDTLNSQGDLKSVSGLNVTEKENLLNLLPPESIVSVTNFKEYEAWYYINDSTIKSASGLSSSQLDSLSNVYAIDSSGVDKETFTIEYTRELDESASDLAKQILTILSTLVVAVSAFYFGSKATEQGGKIAREVFQEAKKDGETGEGIVPMEAIAKAIAENKQKWIDKYHVLNVRPGVQEKNDVSNGKNCIQFVVASKKNYKEEIDKFIPYEYKGKSYEIPTDVVVDSSAAGTSTDNQADTSDQQALIEDYIVHRGAKLREEFPIITGLSYQEQTHGEPPVPTGEFMLVIQIPKKAEKPKDPLPEVIKYKGKTFKVDIQERSATKAMLDIDSRVSRSGDQEFGMLGVPVKKDGKDYVMGCYHVFFNDQVLNKNFDVSGASQVLESPGHGQANTKKVATAIEGRIDKWVDVAICELNAGVKMKRRGAVSNSINRAPVITKQMVGNPVNFFGRGTNNVVNGRIESTFSSQPIAYVVNRGTEEKTIHGLLQMSGVAKGGDSGSLVFDADDRLIGLVVASDDKSTYVITTETIELETDYEIVYDA